MREISVRKAARLRRAVRESLMGQLESKSAALDCFLSLVDDYMELWDVKERLAADIAERGVVLKEISSKGVESLKNNLSVRDLVAVNKQMLSVLKELGLTTGEVTAADDSKGP